jgi:CubicO group peptidase (beta-lactamase class C family)
MTQAALDQALDSAIQHQRLVGGVLIVTQGGKTIYERAFGFADRERNVPAQVDTLFRYASLTKPIVTAAALALIDRGALTLNDPVTKWLPDFKPKLADGSAPAITIRQLMTHTSGLGYALSEPPDGPYHRANVSDGLDQPGLDFAENLRRLASVPLRQRPGTAWMYSLSIDVLGAILEKAANKSLPDVVADLVTQPLGIEDTAFRVVDITRLAVAYVDGKPPRIMRDPDLVPFPPGAGVSFSPARAFDTSSYPSGGGGMTGNARDMVRFLECIRTGGAPIVKRETAAAMMQNQIGDFPTLLPGWGFGFGGAVLRDPKAAATPQTPGTWRWGGVYGNAWFVDPAREITCVLLTNTTLEGMVGKTTIDVRDAVYSG